MSLVKLSKKIKTKERDWTVSPSKRLNETDGNQAAGAALGLILSAVGGKGTLKYVKGSDAHFLHPFILGSGLGMVGANAYNLAKKRKWDHSGTYNSEDK